MKNDEPGRTTGDDHSPRDALHLLNSILEISDQRKVSTPQIMIILDALAGAQDPALVSRFPAVLAICGRRGIELDSSGLLGRYWESNPKRQNLEKLLFISAEIFRRENVAAPPYLRQLAESLKARHAALEAADYIHLTGGPRVAVADMCSAMRQFAGDRPPPRPLPAVDSPRSGQARPAPLELLFSEKQRELIFKKLHHQHLTKTEREYYSRVVKKKLAAIAAPETQELAAALTRASGRKDL